MQYQLLSITNRWQFYFSLGLPVSCERKYTDRRKWPVVIVVIVCVIVLFVIVSWYVVVYVCLN